MTQTANLTLSMTFATSRISPPVSTSNAAPWVRVLVLLVSVLVAAGVAYRTTGSAIPIRSEDAFIFQSALLLVVLGTTLVEYRFTRPSDAAVNALSGIVTLLGVYYIAPSLAWWVTFSYCALVFVASLLCVAVSSGQETTVGWQARVAELTYKPAIVLGRAQVLFSVLFIFGLFAFKSLQSAQTVELVLFWGIFLILWPLGIPSLLTLLTRPAKSRAIPIGRVVRSDWPNLVRVALTPGVTWDPKRPVISQQSDGVQCLVVPLYAQPQGHEVLGTGICLPNSRTSYGRLEPGMIYELPHDAPERAVDLATTLGGRAGSTLVGFVVEGSEVSRIRFEAWDPDACKEGMLVQSTVANREVFYQVVGGSTHEESLQTGRHGIQVATGAQVGELDPKQGFVKCHWLPRMNAPVFSFPSEAGEGLVTPTAEEFRYGSMPTTKIPVVGRLSAALDHHTALLGMTGSGKTELAFDIIRYALDQGIRVICIDLTARYARRLEDLKPQNLSIDAKTAGELGKLMFDAETGSYGAGAEKKALKSFADPLRRAVADSMSAFLTSGATASRLGLITLDEISNTKATLAVTEMYLSCLLESAKSRGTARDRVLVVLEEAHTLVPEASTMGLGDFDSKGMVAKIAQIALQGRKYGVGLLVIAQRTATVSKSILSQCNTIVSFAVIDDTSLGFLSNAFGSQHAELLPNLRPLQAVAFGRGVRAERPVVFEVPFDAAKKRSADDADGRGAELLAGVAS